MQRLRPDAGSDHQGGDSPGHPVDPRGPLFALSGAAPIGCLLRCVQIMTRGADIALQVPVSGGVELFSEEHQERPPGRFPALRPRPADPCGPSVLAADADCG